MATENEMRELRERLARVSMTDVISLFETAIADHRRLWDEEVARQVEAVRVLLELEKAQSVAPGPFVLPPVPRS
jgi:hypothetical protein